MMHGDTYIKYLGKLFLELEILLRQKFWRKNTHFVFSNF